MSADALKSLRPGASWTLNGDTLAGLVWHDLSQTRPSDAEITTEALRLQGVKDVQAARDITIRADAGRVDLMTRLQTATPAQIDSWIDANATNIAGVRTILKALLKAIALDVRK